MKIMVTGANGFLGQHLCRFFKNEYDVFATGKGAKRLPFAEVKYFEADITDANKIKEVVANIQPDVIVHTAAMSRPDECNEKRELCDAINVIGTQHLVDAANLLKNSPHFIYTSSDFVLGEGGPHDEEAIPAPLNYYGLSKLKAEKIVENSGLLWTIVRPVFMYGEIWNGVRPTFLHWVKQSLEDSKQIKVVSDQQRTPSYVVDICKGIQAIIERKAIGLYNLAGEDRLSPYQMAVQLSELFELDSSLIKPVTAETFKEPVQRAKEAGLKIDKAKAELGYKPISFEQGLKSLATNIVNCIR